MDSVDMSIWQTEDVYATTFTSFHVAAGGQAASLVKMIIFLDLVNTYSQNKINLQIVYDRN